MLAAAALLSQCSQTGDSTGDSPSAGLPNPLGCQNGLTTFEVSGSGL